METTVRIKYDPSLNQKYVMYNYEMNKIVRNPNDNSIFFKTQIDEEMIKIYSDFFTNCLRENDENSKMCIFERFFDVPYHVKQWLLENNQRPG